MKIFPFVISGILTLQWRTMPNMSLIDCGGLTNLVYLVARPKFTPQDDQPAVVLLRIQSQTDHDKLLNELVVFTSLAENGLGPKLLGIFPGGRFEEYIPSKHVEHNDITDARICTLLARVLPRFHSTTVPISKRPSLLSTMREWLSLFEEQGNSQVKMRTTSFQLHLNTFPSVITTNELAREIDNIEEFLCTSSSPIVFCHNDLTSGNLLISKKSTAIDACATAQDILLDESTKNKDEQLSMHLVDFEFSAYNHRGFDLANYFCAAAIEHNLQEHPYYKIDLNKLQNRSMKMEFCKEYMKEATRLNIRIKSEYSLLQEIYQFTPIVHLYWAIFNLFCEKDTLAIMDCGAYARDRLALYYQSRSILLDR
ncbi:Choline/ethanolamine kinase [Necator americanus]|uniref:Choline/ethanolamine kinase n=1 Tax=Necator americanus TaxID=51031 RepID=W2SRY1_NECAM|nr:Choline/ethanolamine kinase [Necator americanus]ETN71616.1 Choline/ethanolamine kinase [Necator americanus]